MPAESLDGSTDTTTVPGLAFVELPKVVFSVSHVPPSVVDAATWNATAVALLVLTATCWPRVAVPPASAVKKRPAGDGSGSAGAVLLWISNTATTYCGEFSEWESEIRTRAYRLPAGNCPEAWLGARVRRPGPAGSAVADAGLKDNQSEPLSKSAVQFTVEPESPRSRTFTDCGFAGPAPWRAGKRRPTTLTPRIEPLASTSRA